jgi:hypothetical protein
MTNSPTKRVFFVSPTSVVQEASGGQWEGIPEAPVLYPQHQVKFSDQVSMINSNLTEELVQELWFSRQEIQDFQREANQQATDFCEQHSDLVQALGTLVQTCTNESSLQALLRNPSTHQIMQSLSGTTVRGLEGHLHVIVVRVQHREGLLEIQNLCPKKHDANFLEQLLQSRSQHTSRASRARARLLAHGDYLHMAAIIRQELRELNEDMVLVD